MGWEDTILADRLASFRGIMGGTNVGMPVCNMNRGMVAAVVMWGGLYPYYSHILKSTFSVPNFSLPDIVVEPHGNGTLRTHTLLDIHRTASPSYESFPPICLGASLLFSQACSDVHR